MLLTAGERISMALLCMAVEALGVPAVSFTGSQAGIVTDTDHGKAKIVEVRADRIREALDGGRVAIVAGFQGVSTSRDITTLGRGGSDTTAVALAAALEADVCEIYTDVEGVYSADPRIVPTARKLARVSFDEMLEMAATGGRVLALRSVEFARNHGVKIHVRSSFTWAPGTWVTEEDQAMEQAIISGVTHDISEAKITIEQVPDRPGVAATLFRTLAEAGINVDMIVQNVSTAGHTDISFTLPRDDVAARVGRDGQDRRRDRSRRVPHRRAGRARLARRRGHEDPPRRRRQDVRDARDRRHQHRDDQHVHDSDLVRGRTSTTSSARCRRCTRAFELETA